jgi:riboflavin kinase/FMN adenylyltransferase
VKLYRGLDQLPADFAVGAVAIGNFDGVHRGHARIVERLIRRAQEFSQPAVVFTFEPHPVRLLRPAAAPPPLTWLDRKAALLAELNVDAIIAYPTDDALLNLQPAEYFQRIVHQQLRARAVVEGPNFCFGKDRSGDIVVLQRLCHHHGVKLEVVEPVWHDSDYISSSRVRQAIAVGDVQLANQMLTRPYRIRGMVTHGAGRGAGLGVPTANIQAIDTLLPGPGVYAGTAYANSGTWPAAINVGPNPTFREGETKVEAHLIGFSATLYGQPLEVDFRCRLRDIHTFGSIAQLQAQLRQDIARAATLGSGP